MTEAIAPVYAAFCALAEKEFPNIFVEPAHFRWGAPQLTADEMRVLLRKGKLTSDGWIGDRPEQEWALFVQSAVDKKLLKLRRSGFSIFEQNWLSIYDNLPLPNIHLGNAIDFLIPLLQDRWSQVPSFHTIFVEHGPVIARITESGSDPFVLLDLWE